MKSMFFFVFWHFKTYEKYSDYWVGFGYRWKLSSFGSHPCYRKLELLASRSLSGNYLLGLEFVGLIWNYKQQPEICQDYCCFADRPVCIYHFCHQISGI